MTQDNRGLRTCIVGAGCAGLSAARALAARGLDFDLYEADSDLGGNWNHGVYDGVHLISSRKTSGFSEFPMPDHYPDFPSRLQMRDYLHAYAEHFDLRRRISFGERVIAVRATGHRSGAGWTVQTQSGIDRIYDSVVIANGHLWDKAVPPGAEAFTGKQLHSRDYRNAADIAGPRVLVVGAGNSGCDLVAEAVFAGFDVTLSMRRGHWFLPKTFFGIPRGDLFIGKLPRWLQRPILSALGRVVTGTLHKRGLPRPGHALLSEPPIINSLLFHLLEHGRVRIAPGIALIEADGVTFKDGARERFDTILWATGYKISFPFLEEGHLDWADGVPLRIGGGAIAPRAPGLYFNGLASPRGGNLPMHSACAELIAECIVAQRVVGTSLLNELLRHSAPKALMDGEVREIVADARRTQGIAAACRERRAAAA